VDGHIIAVVGRLYVGEKRKRGTTVAPAGLTLRRHLSRTLFERAAVIRAGGFTATRPHEGPTDKRAGGNRAGLTPSPFVKLKPMRLISGSALLKVPAPPGLIRLSLPVTIADRGYYSGTYDRRIKGSAILLLSIVRKNYTPRRPKFARKISSFWLLGIRDNKTGDGISSVFSEGV
jgi:hypothetical protein